MTENTYSTFEAVKILGIDYMRLNEWLKGINRNPFFHPHQRAEGRGTRTRFTLTDLYRLKVFELMLDVGLSRNVAAHAVEQFRERKIKAEHFENHFVTFGKNMMDNEVLFIVKKDEPVDLYDAEYKGRAVVMPMQVIISLKVVKQLVDSRMEN